MVWSVLRWSCDVAPRAMGWPVCTPPSPTHTEAEETVGEVMVKWMRRKGRGRPEAEIDSMIDRPEGLTQRLGMGVGREPVFGVPIVPGACLSLQKPPWVPPLGFHQLAHLHNYLDSHPPLCLS